MRVVCLNLAGQPGTEQAGAEYVLRLRHFDPGENGAVTPAPAWQRIPAELFAGAVAITGQQMGGRGNLAGAVVGYELTHVVGLVAGF